jgi:hypothetical protein
VRDRLERNPDLLAPPGLERLRVGASRTVAEVQEPARDEARGPVGRDVAEPHREKRPRLLGGNLDGQSRRAEDLDALLERLAREGEREVVVAALVAREVRVRPRTPATGIQSRALG